MWSMGALSEVLPQGQRQGEARRTKRANRKEGSKDSRGEKGTKGSAREARARVARTVHGSKDRGHIKRGARGKELGKVCTASAWISTRRA